MTDAPATNPPKVSIGLPVFNGENFIAEAIDSILAQTFADFELIICDNASSDATEAICRRYAAREPRIRYHRQPANLGACRNYDMTFEMSRGEYFKWAAHDDKLAPTFLETVVALLDADPGCVLAYTESLPIDENGAEMQMRRAYVVGPVCDEDAPVERLHTRLIKQSRIDAVFGLIRREAMARTPLHGDYVGSDQTFLLAMALNGRWARSPERLFLRRLHDLNSTRSHPRHDERTLWYRGTRPRFPVFANFRLLAGFFKAVNGAGLGMRDRLHAYRIVLLWVWRFRWNFFRELMLPFYYNGAPTALGRAAPRLWKGAKTAVRGARRRLKRLPRRTYWLARQVRRHAIRLSRVLRRRDRAARHRLGVLARGAMRRLRRALH